MALWGRVLECERGFRASHAYPLRLYVPLDASSNRRHRPPELVEALGGYGVPVEPLRARCAEAAAVPERERLAALRAREP